MMKQTAVTGTVVFAIIVGLLAAIAYWATSSPGLNPARYNQ